MSTKYKFNDQDQLYFVSFAVVNRIGLKLDYIHYNPVEAGIVENPEDYLYSSARDYCGLPGLIDIILVDPMVG